MLFFDIAKAFLFTVRTFCKPFSTHVYSYVKLIGLCFEFSPAMRTNIGLRHQYEITADSYQQNGNCNVVPRNVDRSAKPIYSAGGER